MRHKKSCASSSAVGFLNDEMTTPAGFIAPTTLRTVPSLPDVSIP